MTYLERLEGVASLTLPEICVRKKPTFMVHHHKKPRKETIHENFKRYQVHPGTISIHFSGYGWMVGWLEISDSTFMISDDLSWSAKLGNWMIPKTPAFVVSL